MTARDDKLNTTWKQVSKAIKTYSWQPIYAKTDAEFDVLVKEMKEKCVAYGYEECRAFTQKEADRRAAFAKAAKDV